MNSSLMICIYRRPGKQASVVFRKSKVLYRITTVEYAPAVVSVFRSYEDALKKNEADPDFVFEILCPKKRHRIVEIGLSGQKAHLCVFEMVGEELKLCFKWTGSREVLREGLGHFTLMAFLNKY
jgi:hypothetical protein